MHDDESLAVPRERRPPVVAMVRVELTADQALIGPIADAASAELSHGCAECIDQYRRGRDESGSSTDRALSTWSNSVASGSALADVAALAVLAACDTVDPAGAAGSHVLRLDLAGESVARTPVAKHPACDRCFPQAALSSDELRRDVMDRWEQSFTAEPEAPVALPALRRRLEVLVGDEYHLFRLARANLAEERGALAGFCRERGVDPRDNALATIRMATAVRLSRSKEIATHGVDEHDMKSAEAIALVEGVERLFTLDHWDASRVVCARFTDVRASALDPMEHPLFAPEQYADPSFPISRFDATAESSWTWGIRLADNRPVLVPLDYVVALRRERPIYRPTSSGAACHSSFYDAVLNALLELVERDAFLSVWLHRRSPPWVADQATGTAGDDVLRGLIALGFTCSHLDITSDVGVPVILGILRDRMNPSLFLPNMVAALDPAQGLRKLHRELAQFVRPYMLKRDAYRTDVTVSGETERVRDFPDHLAFYQDPARHRLAAFLEASLERRALGDGFVQPRAANAREQLALVADRLGKRGFHPIVVDCTTAFVRQLGLHAVRVIVPGLLPLNAGHLMRAVGGRRAPAESNPWPHPFW